MTRSASSAESVDVGRLLAGWRARKRMSQLALSLSSGVSAKHLSFIETGRAKPSRDMIIGLAEALDIPATGCDRLLIAAGFVPTGLNGTADIWDPVTVQPALAMLLRSVEPAGAVAYGTGRDLLMANDTYVASVRPVLPDRVQPLTLIESPGPNLLKLLFAPDGFRTFLGNWETVAAGVFERAHKELALTGDSGLQAVLESIVAQGWVPASFHDLNGGMAFGVPVELVQGCHTIRLRSTIASFGPGFGAAGSSIHVEVFHPLSDRDRILLVERKIAMQEAEKARRSSRSAVDCGDAAAVLLPISRANDQHASMTAANIT